MNVSFETADWCWTDTSSVGTNESSLLALVDAACFFFAYCRRRLLSPDASLRSLGATLVFNCRLNILVDFPFTLSVTSLAVLVIHGRVVQPHEADLRFEIFGALGNSSVARVGVFFRTSFYSFS